jgi:hypothetical protein
MVDVEPVQLVANHLTASDLSLALSNQNLVTPSGTEKIGDREYLVGTNSSPATIAELNALPIRTVSWRHCQSWHSFDIARKRFEESAGHIKLRSADCPPQKTLPASTCGSPVATFANCTGAPQTIDAYAPWQCSSRRFESRWNDVHRRWSEGDLCFFRSCWRLDFPHLPSTSFSRLHLHSRATHHPTCDLQCLFSRLAGGAN